MMPQIEENDSGFTSLWSTKTQLECGTLFLNPKFKDDIFFDKLTNVTCISEKMIDETILQFQKYNSKPFLYSLNYKEFERFLQQRGFVYSDTQHVLRKRTTLSPKPSTIKISHNNYSVWTKIFCEAYDCIEWAETINSVVKNSLSSAEYYVDKSSSSCMVLYEKNSILGLYCLGTLPNERNQGNAASLINFALHKVKEKGLDYLMLETYEKDNLLNFYSKLGFERIYYKTVYTI